MTKLGLAIQFEDGQDLFTSSDACNNQPGKSRVIRVRSRNG